MKTDNNLAVNADCNSLQLNTPAEPPDPKPLSHTETNICQLNDDCLLYIFKQLSFVNQFNFARSSARFHHAFSLSFRLNYKEFDADHVDWKHFTMHEMHELLSLAGKHIKVITARRTIDKSILKFLCTFCPNVTSLKLWKFSETIQLIEVIKSTQIITELCLYGHNIVDQDILVLKKLTQLKKLSVRSHAISGQYFSELRKLQLLDLNECFRLQSKYLMEILKALVDLQTLNVRDCRGFNVDVCHQMVRYSTKLESLEIDFRESGFEIIARLPLLKYLHCSMDHMAEPIAENVVKIFNGMANHANQLEHLKLVGQTVITNLSHTLNCVKNLKVLDCEVLYSPFNFCLMGSGFVDSILMDSMEDEWLMYFSKMENLEKLILTCARIKMNNGLLHLLTNCKHLSHVEIKTITIHPIDAEFVHKLILILSNNTSERVLPVTLILDEINTLPLDAEYDKAAKDGIINIIFHRFQRNDSTDYSNYEESNNSGNNN